MNNGVLSQLRARLAGWLVLRVGLLLLGVIGAAALAALLLDAALDLSDAARVLAPWMLGVGVVAVLGAGVWQWRRLDEKRVARLFEWAEPSLGTRLTNAVQLAAQVGATGVGEFLRCDAVELGQRAAAGVKTWPAVRRAVKVAFLSAGATVLAWIALITLGGDVMEAEWPRFLDPLGDHPPFSRLHIAVEPGRAQTLFGGQVEVRARAEGRPVDKLWLVTKAGTNVSRTIMFLSPDKTFFQTLANLREATEYFITDGQARSHRFPINIRYTPQITLVEVTTQFPDYTSKPVRTAKLADEPQALPADTRVSFRVASNRPLKSGALTLTPVLGGKPVEVALEPESPEQAHAGRSGDARTDGRGVPPHPNPLPQGEGVSQSAARKPETARTSEARPSVLPLPRGEGRGEGTLTNQPTHASHVVTGGFTLAEPTLFTLSVRDVDGLNCAEPRRGRLNVLPDERPRLFVLEPGRDAVATPGIRVPVKAQATDDYGITRVVWLRGHNRSLERPFNMKLALKNGTSSVEAAGAFDLEKLGVRPGDVIEYYFEAADNYPKGPNITLSRMYRLEVISKEQYQEVLRQQAAKKALFEPYFQHDAWLRRLAERARKLEKDARAGTDPAKTEKEAKELAEELEKYEQSLGKLMQNPMMFDVEQSFRTSMVAQHTRVSQARKKLSNALGNGQLDTKKLSQLSDELSELTKDEEENVGQPAQQIAAVAHLLARADAFVKLAAQEAAIAQLLRRFTEKAEPLSRVEQMEVQELAHQQQRVQEGLGTLLAQLPDLLSKVPEEPNYESLRKDVNAFLKAVAEAKIEPDLSSATKALREPDAMTGHALAKLAAEKMDKLIGKCNGMQKQGKQCLTARFQPKLQKPGLGNTMEQILAAMGVGTGESGRDGYGLFNDDVGLYGPNMELAGEQAGGKRDDSGPAGQGRQIARVAGDTRDAGLTQPGAPGRVRLQPDAKFPLRYRDLVGDYFRAIAESGTEEGEKR